MGLFEELTAQAQEIAGKVGISPDVANAVMSSLQEKLGNGSSQAEALKAAAVEHGLPLETIQAMLAHAQEGGGGLLSGLGGLASGF